MKMFKILLHVNDRQELWYKKCHHNHTCIKITSKNDLSAPVVIYCFFYMKHFLSLHNQTNSRIVTNHLYCTRDYVYPVKIRHILLLMSLDFMISAHQKENIIIIEASSSRAITMCQTLF